MKPLTLGYIPLTDALPLIAAQELGYFSTEGLDVSLQQEVSWANIRDKLVVGELDAAQILSPMIIATSLGLGTIQEPLISAYMLNLNGNALTVSHRLFELLEHPSDPEAAGHAFKRIVQKGGGPFTLATVFPFSCHNLALQAWLRRYDINVGKDIRLVVLPPSQMVDHLGMHHIDGFMAGEPWNTLAIMRGIGQGLLSSTDIWPMAPEKALAVRSRWDQQNPEAHASLLVALYRAGQWLEEASSDAVSLLAKYLPLELEVLKPALQGQFVAARGADKQIREVPNMLVFNRHLANYPWPEYQAFFIQQLREAGFSYPALYDKGGIESLNCFRVDLYRRALPDLVYPTENRGQIGIHSMPWELNTSHGKLLMPADSQAVDKHQDKA